MGDEEEVAILIIVLIILKKVQERHGVRRSCWTRPWLARRPTYGACHDALVQELAAEDPQGFINLMRMDRESFTKLTDLVTPHIRKKDTNMREAISPAERLAVTLRFLATGDSYTSLQYLYRISKQSISTIIPETCDAIYQVLRDYIKVPNSNEDWLKIAKEFEDRWQFSNCVGALDGKHVTLNRPVNSGSACYDYKQFHSVVLMALVDADYKFIFVDVGCSNGTVSDGGVFGNSTFSAMLENNELSIPPPRPLPGRQIDVPYVIVGDGASFPLKPYLVKPYPGNSLGEDMAKRMFNYRLSRAGRVVENVFGIMAQRFGVFRKPLSLKPDTAIKVVMATCALHNFLRTNNQQGYMPHGSIDTETENGVVQPGEWRNQRDTQMRPLGQQGGNRNSRYAREIREEFADYFVTNGQIPWQWELV